MTTEIQSRPWLVYALTVFLLVAFSSVLYFATRANPDTRAMAFLAGASVIFGSTVSGLVKAHGIFGNAVFVGGIAAYYALIFLPLPFYLKTRRLWIICVQLCGIILHFAFGHWLMNFDPGG